MAKKSAPMKKNMSKKAVVGIGVGVTAALLSAAGAYFLYGSKNAPKNRKMVKSWMLKAKAEVLDGIEAAQNMTKEDYEKLVDRSVKTYSKIKGATPDELVAFAREMKGHWKNLEGKGLAGAIKAAAKKKVKKAVKKVAKAA